MSIYLGPLYIKQLTQAFCSLYGIRDIMLLYIQEQVPSRRFGAMIVEEENSCFLREPK